MLDVMAAIKIRAVLIPVTSRIERVNTKVARLRLGTSSNMQTEFY